MSPTGCGHFDQPPERPSWVWDPVESRRNQIGFIIVVGCFSISGGLTAGLCIAIASLVWGVLPVSWLVAFVTCTTFMLRLYDTPSKSWWDEYYGWIIVLTCVGVTALFAYGIGTLMVPELPPTEILCQAIFGGFVIGFFTALLISVAISVFAVIQHNYKSRRKR